jgi:two-component system invasion response regulator UvrY
LKRGTISMIEILVADDHTIVRQGLREILDKEPDLHVKDEAANGSEVLEKISRQHFDVIILDITMPGRSGIEILKEIKSRRKNSAVLILSMYSEEEYAIRAFKSGAAGYLSKKYAISELIEAIRKVAAGGKYISENVAHELAFRIDRYSQKAPHEILSDREFEVLCLIGSGKSVSEIARELSLSISSVSTYRSHIKEKMKLKNNMEMIHYVIKNDLISR